MFFSNFNKHFFLPITYSTIALHGILGRIEYGDRSPLQRAKKGAEPMQKTGIYNWCKYSWVWAPIPLLPYFFWPTTWLKWYSHLRLLLSTTEIMCDCGTYETYLWMNTQNGLAHGCCTTINWIIHIYPANWEGLENICISKHVEYILTQNAWYFVYQVVTLVI